MGEILILFSPPGALASVIKKSKEGSRGIIVVSHTGEEGDSRRSLEKIAKQSFLVLAPESARTVEAICLTRNSLVSWPDVIEEIDIELFPDICGNKPKKYSVTTIDRQAEKERKQIIEIPSYHSRAPPNNGAFLFIDL